MVKSVNIKILLVLLLVSNAFGEHDDHDEFLKYQTIDQAEILHNKIKAIYPLDAKFSDSITSILPQDAINKLMIESTSKYVPLEGIEPDFNFKNITFDFEENKLTISLKFLYKFLKPKSSWVKGKLTISYNLEINKGQIAIENLQYNITVNSLPQTLTSAYIDTIYSKTFDSFKQLLQEKVNGHSVIEVFQENFMIPIYNLIPDSVPLEWLVNNSDKLSLFVREKYLLLLFHV